MTDRSVASFMIGNTNRQRGKASERKDLWVIVANVANYTI
jgi:hypothetical protein